MNTKGRYLRGEQACKKNRGVARRVLGPVRLHSRQNRACSTRLSLGAPGHKSGTSIMLELIYLTRRLFFCTVLAFRQAFDSRQFMRMRVLNLRPFGAIVYGLEASQKCGLATGYTASPTTSTEQGVTAAGTPMHHIPTRGGRRSGWRRWPRRCAQAVGATFSGYGRGGPTSLHRRRRGKEE